MVKEEVLWFGEEGSPTLKIPLTVESACRKHSSSLRRKRA